LVEKAILYDEAGLRGVLRRESTGTVVSGEGKELGSLGLTVSICASTTREENDLITGGTTLVEVDTSVRQGADNESLVFLADIVLSSSDQVELLVGAAVTGGGGNGDQVLAEVTGDGVDEKAVSI
jgi:hypothetical protein